MPIPFATDKWAKALMNELMVKVMKAPKAATELVNARKQIETAWPD